MGRRVERDRGGGGGAWRTEPVVDTRTVAATAQSGSTAEGGKTVVMDKSARADTYIIITGSTNRPARISV